MNATDHELILACRKGDNKAWEEVMKKYERLVYSIPLNYGLSHDDAADIVQITFTILIQSMDSLREDSRLGPWLGTVAKRHTWRLVERRRRESTQPDEDLSESVALLADAESEKPMERWELVEWLEQGLDLLNERCAELLRALYFDSKEPSYEEIADALHIKVGSIGPTRARCLKRLKDFLTTNS